MHCSVLTLPPPASCHSVPCSFVCKYVSFVCLFSSVLVSFNLQCVVVYLHSPSRPPPASLNRGPSSFVRKYVCVVYLFCIILGSLDLGGGGNGEGRFML